MSETILKKEDYEDSCCSFSTYSKTNVIPIGRVLEKLDEYLGKNQYEMGEQHLNYWLQEADISQDLQGKLTIYNEQIGLYRKMNKEKECLQAIEYALQTLNRLHMESNVLEGTTYLNVATGYKAFDKVEKSIAFYQKAQLIYESHLNQNDEKLAGLYNNMALAIMEKQDFEIAKEYFEKALLIMAQQSHGEAEMAITYLNLADLVASKKGLEDGLVEITTYVQKAETLLNTETLPRDGHYAFVCEKCAPSFGYYGYFATEMELLERARKIYERS